MTNLAIWVSKPYDKGALFKSNSPLNRDNCLAPHHALQEKVILNGGRYHTQDVYIKEDSIPDIVLFLDIPPHPVDKLLGKWSQNSLKWVILEECEVIKPRNWNLKLHNQFDKIFTWHDVFAKNEKYCKLNFSNLFPKKTSKVRADTKEKFCALIAGNKRLYHPLELYSKRIETIRWFEKNHPDEFDLYGIGWDRPFFSGTKLARILNRITFIRKRFASRFPSYKGSIGNKRAILEKYKFSICYENATDIPGYITEKIFDCFFAECIPVYWGANNVTDHIPNKCFIDRRNFANHEDLYEYMKKMDNNTYDSYIDNINNYLQSNQSYEFTDRYFAETIVNEITDLSRSIS